MTDQKQILLRWIEEDRDKLVNFLSRFIQAKSPNPPGDTRAAATHIRQFLDEKTLPYIMWLSSEYKNVILLLLNSSLDLDSGWFLTSRGNS